MPNLVSTLASPSPCSLASPPSVFVTAPIVGPDIRKQCESSSWIISLAYSLDTCHCLVFLVAPLSIGIKNYLQQVRGASNSSTLDSNVHRANTALAGYSQKFTDDRYCNVKQRSSNVHPSRHVGGILGRAWEQHVN